MKKKQDSKNSIKESSDVLFTGLVRDLPMFKRSVNDMIDLQKQGLVNNIMYSTWTGEVDKYPELRDFIKQSKILLIESKEPEEIGLENIWGQMKALDLGLRRVDKDRFVLKTRPDVYIPKEFLKDLFANKLELLKITHDLPNGNVFKYKIWSTGYELTKPFFIAEACYYGHVDDMKKSVNYDRDFDSKYSAGKGLVHVRRWAPPFLEQYPLFYKTLTMYKEEVYVRNKFITNYRKYVPIEKLKIFSIFAQKRRFYFLRKRLKTDKEYLACLAAYYYILYSHFYITWANVTFRDKYTSIPFLKFNLNVLEKNFSESKVRKPHLTEVYVQDELLNKPLVEGRLKQTPLYGKLMNAIREFKTSYQGQR